MVVQEILRAPNHFCNDIGDHVDIVHVDVIGQILLAVRAGKRRPVDTRKRKRAQAHAHRRVGVGGDIRHVDGAVLVMERRRHLAHEAHDALVALEHTLLALRGNHGNLAGAHAFKVDEEDAT